MSRFIENKNFLVPQQRLRETDSLQISLRERLHFFAPVLFQSQQLDDKADALLNLGVGNSGERGVADECRLGAPAGRNGNQLGQVANAVPLDEASRRRAVDFHTPRRRTEITKQHGDEGALPRTVRPGDAEYLARLYHQRKLLDRFYRVAEE